MFDIHDLMTGLAKNHKAFREESDFRDALVGQIHEAMPESCIRLEADVLQSRDHRIFLDLWLPVEGIAIELKYATRKVELEEGGKSLALINHGAHAEKRYSFMRDIERLERTRSGVQAFRAGYAVLLTNDSAYWKIPRKGDFVDAAFRIHEGRGVSGELAWAPHAGKGTTEGRENPIRLQGSYQLQWRDFSEFPVEGYNRFRYLAVPVT